MLHVISNLGEPLVGLGHDLSATIISRTHCSIGILPVLHLPRDLQSPCLCMVTQNGVNQTTGEKALERQPSMGFGISFWMEP
jgi:hypothetical protein